MNHSKLSYMPPLAAGVFVGCSCGLLGCSHEQAPPRSAAAVAEPAEAAPRTSLPLGTTTSPITLSEVVQVRCNIPDTPKEDPLFDFDEADLRPRGENILDNLADCLTQGDLRGEQLILTGHADPRGSDSYNQELGMERAVAVRDYLANHGIAMSSLAVKSRGEQDATGTDPQSWQLDRRVDVDVEQAM